jgi:hypothetical protein
MRTRIGVNWLAASAAMVCSALFMLSAHVGTALAAEEPTQFLLTSHVGRNVDATKTKAGASQEERNQCTSASHDECQLGGEGTGPREFAFSDEIAVSKLNGDVYVSDRFNHRIQVLGADGSFLFMFGWKVDKTTGGNVCTAVSGDECGPGEGGTGLAQQLGTPSDVAVDPSSGNVYVLDNEYHRVDEYTAGGQFVLMIGGLVNKNGTNVCRSSEESECQAGRTGSGQGEFDELALGKNPITVGREDHLLYVGDSCPSQLAECKSAATKARVQRFEADGTWVGQTSLDSLSEEGAVTGVAVNSTGSIFVTDNAVSGVHEVSLGGQLESCVIDAGDETQKIDSIAFDAYGRLGVLEHTFAGGEISHAHATLYDTRGAQCGTAVSGEIAPPSGQMAFGVFEGSFIHFAPKGLSFSENEEQGNLDRLYVVDTAGSLNEIEIYKPSKFPIVRTCSPSEARFTKARLCAEVNPNGLAASLFFKYWIERETENHTLEVFEEKRTPIAFSGSGISFETVQDEITGLVPNQVYSDEAFAEAEVEGEQVQASGPPPLEFRTQTPPPEVPGAPEAQLVRSQSAVLKATLNPEHAATEYRFEYAPCAGEAHTFAECGKRVIAPERESAQYGLIAASQEVAGLSPQTRYVFRLRAVNSFVFGSTHEGGETLSEREGVFTTAALPEPQALTGGAVSIGASTATIFGEADPAGEPASYVFELGVYKGAATQYGIVFSGQAGSGDGFVQEQLALSGLQPATTYAYRIGVRSGYVLAGKQVFGQVDTFTTTGVPEAISLQPPPVMLPMPPIKWPATVKVKPKKKCKRGYKLNKHHRCVKVKTSKHKAKRRSSAHTGRRRRG